MTNWGTDSSFLGMTNWGIDSSFLGMTNWGTDSSFLGMTNWGMDSSFLGMTNWGTDSSFLGMTNWGTQVLGKREGGQRGQAQAVGNCEGCPLRSIHRQPLCMTLHVLKQRRQARKRCGESTRLSPRR